MITINIANIKQYILLFLLLCITKSVWGDDKVQNSLNLNYFRTPEASAFKKYGEESVNEYTGTADISVPLYTIKSNDIEIPLVLRYDASGIKVEQEASWVGLGWNLMVGGCINYVCAGGKDQCNQAYISDQTWMEYLTTVQSPSPIKYFDYNKDNKNTWMETVNHSFAFETPYSSNLSMEMQNYLRWGFGERDFYSVNVLGKSFKFFIDPATLNPHIIGSAGEDYKIESDDMTDVTGIGHQPDVKSWTITDSNGYIYYFTNGDTTTDNKGINYIFCWYLTGIKTPSGEKVSLSYTKQREWGRKHLTESFSQFHKSVSNGDQAYGQKGYSYVLNAGWVSNSYVKEIKTSNQTVTFSMTDSYECSGKRLDAITVKSFDQTVIRKFNFSYGSFDYTSVGGNYAPASNSKAELRLKLNSVKEIGQSDTLTTSFSYNSEKLPSKKSCAQDYWGYYNGKNNPSTTSFWGCNGHTMLPTPSTFMTHNWSYIDILGDVKGADRNPNGKYMQAAILNKVVYPTGGCTLYEYEPNTISVGDYKQSLEYEEYLKRGYDIEIHKSFSYTPDIPIDNKVSNEPYSFTLTDSLAFTLSFRCSGPAMNGKSIQINIIPMSPGILPVLIPLTYQNSDDYKVILNDVLPPGNYQLQIGAPASGNQCYSIGCWLKGNYPSNSFFNLYPQKTFNRAVGGLRIKTISNYDNDGKKINYTTYDYNNSGILLNSIETIEPYSFTYLKAEDGGHGTRFIYSTHSISGCNITTGQPRLATFYASCNPGIVGYSKVTKCKYDPNGNPEKYVLTTYKNHKPEVSMMNMDFYKCLDNGKMISQQILNANKNVVFETVNEYRTHEMENDEEKDKWFSTNMLAVDHLKIDPMIQGFNPDDPTFNTRFQIWKYPYILSRVDLIKTTTTEKCSDGKTVVKKKEYKYKNNNGNLQVYQTDENTSLTDQIRRTKTTYSSDGIDVASRSMRDKYHRLNDVVKTENILVENGKERCLSVEKTNYTSRLYNGSLHYLPGSFSTSIGNATLETRDYYSYDDSLNVSSIKIDGLETVYIWSYYGQYPIAKIEGLTYSEVETAIGASTISSLLKKSKPTDSDLSTMRTAINNKGGYITTYTYKPLVGMLSETKPNGMKITYQYDGLGRLVCAKDHNGKTVVTNSYNYKK